MKKHRSLVMGFALVAMFSAVAPATAAGAAEQKQYNAMWLSILHPGVGEWYLNGWGGFANCPQRKFWLGFIPVFGWPGYLQVKSAVDARHGRTNDDLGLD